MFFFLVVQDAVVAVLNTQRVAANASCLGMLPDTNGTNKINTTSRITHSLVAFYSKRAVVKRFRFCILEETRKN